MAADTRKATSIAPVEVQRSATPRRVLGCDVRQHAWQACWQPIWSCQDITCRHWSLGQALSYHNRRGWAAQGQACDRGGRRERAHHSREGARPEAPDAVLRDHVAHDGPGARIGAGLHLHPRLDQVHGVADHRGEAAAEAARKYVPEQAVVLLVAPKRRLDGRVRPQSTACFGRAAQAICGLACVLLEKGVPPVRAAQVQPRT